jgi:hypothetical protein
MCVKYIEEQFVCHVNLIALMSWLLSLLLSLVTDDVNRVCIFSKIFSEAVMRLLYLYVTSLVQFLTI